MSRIVSAMAMKRVGRRLATTPVAAVASNLPSPSHNVWCLRSRSPLGVLSLSTLASNLKVSENTDNDLVPITLLSGFLGSGKTTTLQHLLENKDGLKIGVLVNDMASVNIDAKLVKQQQDDGAASTAAAADGIVELQNGCVCCSLSDELLGTVEKLLESKRQKSNNDATFDALVIELSGVSDPVSIQQNWKQARKDGHPVTKRAELQKVVTLIDASTFGTDWMTWDAAGERDGWVDPIDKCAAGRKVPELLAEQIESADVLLLNKIDLAEDKQLDVAEALARSINEKAVVEKVEFGKLRAPQQILREDVAGRETTQTTAGTTATEGDTSSGEESTASSHDHSHEYAHDHAHDYAHSQDVSEETSQSEAEITAPSSHESHAHNHSHSHAHSHDHDSSSTSMDVLGIVNFVYKSDRPFETRKIMALLRSWPVPNKEDLEGLGYFRTTSAALEQEGRESPFFGVLRSKGFCWLAPSQWKTEGGGDAWLHDVAMYWSHAGKHFGFTVAGKWWATVEPSRLREYFRKDPSEYERILREDFVSKQWGDRRQELVFIGAGIDEEKITKALDACLVGEKGMERYTEHLNNFMSTR